MVVQVLNQSSDNTVEYVNAAAQIAYYSER